MLDYTKLQQISFQDLLVFNKLIYIVLLEKWDKLNGIL